MVSQAIEDFGIKEENILRAVEPIAAVQDYSEFERVRNKVGEEAIHGALRIAGLVG